MKTSILSLLFFCALSVFGLTGCLDSETASLSTTQGDTSATLDANPGIVQGQSITSTNSQGGSVVNQVNGLGLIMSLPATSTGTATATFKNTPAMQLADDAAGLKAFAQNAAATLKAYAPQLVAVANDTAAFTELVQQITSDAGWTPATPSQHSIYVEIETNAKLAATSVTALDNFLSTVQQTGSPATN